MRAMTAMENWQCKIHDIIILKSTQHLSRSKNSGKIDDFGLETLNLLQEK
jgi:hypothetical protein